MVPSWCKVPWQLWSRRQSLPHPYSPLRAPAFFRIIRNQANNPHLDKSFGMNVFPIKCRFSEFHNDFTNSNLNSRRNCQPQYLQLPIKVCPKLWLWHMKCNGSSAFAFACFLLVLAPTHTSAVAQLSKSVFAVSTAAVTLRQDGEQPPETAAQADCATRCAGPICTKDVEDPGPTGIPVCAGEYT